MANARYSFDGELWEWEGKASWHFVSVPEELADEIEALHGHNANGFGSVKVHATIGATTWTTSMFPDKKRATYILPVKKPVRVAEDLAAGEALHVDIEIAVG
ncbi:DUF1905 domain-containing protein [Nocardia sp. NPDC005978]|uniref:DUF1905 domain-containing protein n=1 Tax=unclassified Nocardia TaxID=2637762 RepID=UPI0033AD504D